MGAGSEGTQSVEIDWDNYYTERDEWGDRSINCERCLGSHYYVFGLQEAIDWAKDHDPYCPKR